ncbi:MAG: tyrosine-type recombinase/integrase [Oscillospiraceae bacterium]|nr:tyrosine-type recombinase/integrase [Oscillospiraceae bacterium]
MNINKADYPEFVNDYIFYLRIVKGRAETTVNEYFINVRMFLRYVMMMKEDIDKPLDEISVRNFKLDYLKEITLKDIYDFEFYLAEERHNGSAARARKTAALKSFFYFMTKRANLLEKNPIIDIEMPSTKKTMPKYLSLEESLRLLTASEADNPERDYCIITLFLNCGMRLSELVNINISDIDFTERRLRLLGKGNKERIIYINDACISAINLYLKSRKNPPGEPNALFLSRNNRRISRRRVQQIVDSSLARAGLAGKGLSTHKLRHTAATLMYQHGGVDTLVLKDILGHKSIATTEIYTHISDELKKNAADCSPLANVKKRNDKDE